MQMKVYRTLLLMLLVFKIFFGAIITKTQYQHGNRYLIGYNDGTRGPVPENFTNYFSACKEAGDSHVDVKASHPEWQVGIEKYCRLVNAYTLGFKR